MEKEKMELPKTTPHHPSYDKSHDLRKLMFILVVVSEGQSGSIIKYLYEHEASMAYIMHGRGTSKNDFYDVLGMGVSNKDVVISVIREEQWPEIKEEFGKRFSVSEASKGIAYTVPIDSIVGVSIYKMLANIQVFEKPKVIEKKRKERKKHGN